MNENDIPTKLLWMDLEMTGLNPENQRIIEVAVVVTDFELKELARYEAVIHRSAAVLDNAEDWPKENMHALFEQSEKSDVTEDQVKAQLLALIEDNFGDEKAVLAGNSIHQDRRFIRKWWPEIDRKLHYRMFDVSTLKIWAQGAMRKQFEKSETHRAMDDIQESIEELKWALQTIREAQH